MSGKQPPEYFRRYAAEHKIARLEYMKSWRRDNPEKASAQRRKRNDLFKQKIAELKDRPCADCGGTFPPYVLDFDHRPDEEKLFEVARGRSKAWSSVLVEIAKCDLVCANCHRMRTESRRQDLDGQVDVG